MKYLKCLAAIAIVLSVFGCKKEEIKVEATAITLNKTTLTLELGKTATLQAAIAPTNATNQTVTWSSSNTGIATIAENGEVMAVAIGHATIIATTSNGKIATCEVTVAKAGDPKTINDIACVYIPSGTFMMGSPESDKDAYDNEKPQHKVTLTKGFYMSKCEITNAQFAQFLNAKYVTNDGTHGGKTLVKAYEWGVQYNFATSKWEAASGYDNYPIVGVSCDGADEYARWVGGALPTEAQWEYACRAGSTSKMHFGDDKSQLGNYAWYNDSKTHQVGTKQPNAWGLYDMHGNVWERCSDWYEKNYYSNSPTNDPTGPTLSLDRRVGRGGSYSDMANRCRSAYRISATLDFYGNDVGFRVVFPVE